ncbi:nucleotidyltransferase domain-containing protein [Alicyclobacillus mengziensis]|uniref:Aminoglycoside-2''-adenylyltransferase n=1 Tax=Alicyclobacillus mengziensis TaxID=2931921 RepID=A0A9X7W108_9BACL|nr:hypothetical protein [Alicyclobacillus mengziensis]QSO47363.1 hypothetical protein JZ786_23745 [Alicyclobacillus mengziensis]
MDSEQLDSVAELMKDFQYPWLIAGGWSIDLALGAVTRQHEDVDICVFRQHVQGVLDYFSDWDIAVAIPGEHRLEPCRTVQDTSPPRFGLHLRKGEQFIEILLTDRIDDEVIFRRDPSIRMPLHDFIRMDNQGRKYVAPEWQLLFKSKEGREKDEQDFTSYISHCSEQQREWLLTALKTNNPNSKWITMLELT